jgi:hypothetical protein
MEVLMKVSIRHNIGKAGIEFLSSIGSAIENAKKQMHKAAADVIKDDIKLHYDEVFQEAVNPNSSWQRLKVELGLQGKPGHFTGATLNSIVAEATDEIGRVMLKGKWPEKAKLKFSGGIEFTPDGIKINPYRDDSKAIRTKGLTIPTEDFEGKTYGIWSGKDIQFMRLRDEAERKAVSESQKVLDAEISKVLGKFSANTLKQHIEEIFKNIEGGK